MNRGQSKNKERTPLDGRRYTSVPSIRSRTPQICRSSVCIEQRKCKRKDLQHNVRGTQGRWYNILTALNFSRFARFNLFRIFLSLVEDSALRLFRVDLLRRPTSFVFASTLLTSLRRLLGLGVGLGGLDDGNTAGYKG